LDSKQKSLGLISCLHFIHGYVMPNFSVWLNKNSIIFISAFDFIFVSKREKLSPQKTVNTMIYNIINILEQLLLSFCQDIKLPT